MHSATVAARRLAMAFAEQHAGQLSAGIEDRSARVALPGSGRKLDHFEREIGPWRNILRAAATNGAIRTRTVTGDRQGFAGAGALGDRRTGCTFGLRIRRAAKSQSRSVFKTSAGERNPSGNCTVIGPLAASTTCQLVTTSP